MHPIRIIAALLIASISCAAWAETVVATIPAGTSPNSIAVNTVTNKIYVPNQNSNNVTVIDGATNTTTTVAVGMNPGFIAVNPVTNKVYVTNMNSSNVTVIDGANNTTTVAAGGSPFGVAVNPVTNIIYVANEGDGTVTVIDGSNDSIVTTVGVGSNPFAVAVNPATNMIYVTNNSSNNVSVIDGAANTVTATVTAGTQPDGVSVNPVTNTIYVSNNGSSNITIIDGASNTPSTVAVGTAPFALAVNAVTNKIYVGNTGSNNVSVIDGVSGAVTATIGTGNFPRAVAVNPATNKIFANSNSNSVTIIDGGTNTPSTVTVGSGAGAAGVNPLTDKIYIANVSSNDVTVIDGAVNSSSTVAVGNTPAAVAINAVTNKIYVANSAAGSVTEIDGTTNTTVTIAAGNDPRAVAINPAANKIYVGNINDATVTVIDGATHTTSTLTVGHAPIALVTNPVTNKTYVADFNVAKVTVIDGVTNATTSIAVGGDPIAIAVNPVTNKIYVVNNQDGTLMTIDGVTETVTSVVTLGSEPFAVAVNPVTNKIYVVNRGDGFSDGTVTAVDGATNATITVTVGLSPVTVEVNPVTNVIYVANSGTDTVTVIDGVTNNTATITVGVGVASLVVDPTINKIYVTNKLSNTVAIIDGATQTITATVNAGNSPQALAFNPQTHYVYAANFNSADVTVISPTTLQPAFLLTAINPLPGNRASSDTPTFTLGAVSSFFPNSPPIQQLYYQLDTQSGPWNFAGAGSSATFTAPSLQGGTHTLFAYASDGQDATSTNTGSQSSPIPGAIAAYTFVVPAQATVNLSGLNLTFNGAPQAATVTTTPAGLATNATYNGSATPPTNAGSYSVVATLVPIPAYFSSNANAMLTIAMAGQTITFGALTNQTYGASAFALTATSDSGLPVSFAVTAGSATINGNTLSMTGAGSVTVQATQTGNANFNAATPVIQSFNVIPAPLSITANDATKVFNTFNPSLSATYSGFVNGETPANLTGSLSLTTVATATSNVGNYPVIPSGQSSLNYVITFNNGMLAITRATPAVTWANPAPIAAGTALGATQLDTTANIPGTFVYAPTEGTVLSPGGNQTLVVFFTPSDLTNYIPTKAVVAISVTPAAPQIVSQPSATPNPGVAGEPIVFAAAASEAGGAPLNFSWNFGDGAVGSGSIVTHTFSLAGTFTVTLTVTDPANMTETAMLALAIVASSNAGGVTSPLVISNANGIPDQMQSAAAAAGIIVALPPQALPDANLSIKLNFAKPGNDAISLSGTLIRPAGFTPAGQSVIIDVGGVVKTFALNSKASIKIGNDQFAISLKGAEPASAKFTMKLSKGSYASTLAGAGLTNANAKKLGLSVPIGILFAGNLWVVSQSQLYTATKGKSGATKTLK